MVSPQARASVLLVEDEALIRMLFAEVLADLGHSVAARAGTLASGLALAKARDYQLAILDIDLNGKPAFPIADVVKARGKALLFVTGHGSSSLAADHEGAAVLQKPFSRAQLSHAISSALARAA